MKSSAVRLLLMTFWNVSVSPLSKSSTVSTPLWVAWRREQAGEIVDVGEGGEVDLDGKPFPPQL
jgi:hypothetical protein